MNVRYEEASRKRNLRFAGGSVEQPAPRHNTSQNVDSYNITNRPLATHQFSASTRDHPPPQHFKPLALFPSQSIAQPREAPNVLLE